MAARLTLKQDYEALLDKYDTWLFDCDGVLWQGDQLVDGVVEVLELLRNRSEYMLPPTTICADRVCCTWKRSQ